MDFRELNELRSIEELATYQKELQERKDELNLEFDGLPFSDDAREEYARCDVEEREIDKRVKELRARLEDVKRRGERAESVEQTTDVFQTSRPGVVKGDAIYDLTTVRRSWDNPSVEASELRDRARRAIEQARFPTTNERERMQGNLEQLTAEIDGEDGRFSRYLLTTGSPQYRRAFEKYLAGAPRTQNDDQLLYRAASLTSASGGYAVPFVLDPTVVQTGSGAINPYRTIGSVAQITGDNWNGVTSTGITAAFQAE